MKDKEMYKEEPIRISVDDNVGDVSDAKIISLFNARSEDALKLVERKYGRLCLSVARNVLGNNEDAEQCANDAYLSVWESIPPANPKSLAAYISAITRNKAINVYKSARAEKRGGGRYEGLLSEFEEDIVSRDRAEDLFDKNYAANIINAYLHSLPKEQASVFVLRYYFFYSVEDISDKTGYSYEKVASMLFRLRKGLKQRLEKEGVEL